MIKWSLLIDKLIWFFILLLFCSFYIFNSNTYSRFILLGITVIIGGLLLVKYNGRIPLYWHSFHSMVCLFVAFCLFSYMWSIDPVGPLLNAFIISQIFICMSVLYIYFVNFKTTEPLLNIIAWGGYLTALYSIFYYGPSNIRYILLSAGRLTNAFTNVNSLGMLMAISAIISGYQILFNKFQLKHLLVIPTIMVLAAAGSRTGLLAFLIGIILIVLIKFSKRNWVLSLFQYISVGIVTFLILKILLGTVIFEGINGRVETLFNLFRGNGEIDGSTMTRHWMIRIGWQQFLDTPFLGIGIGSSGLLLLRTMGWETYLHNNYIEMLACGGLVGTVLYYSLFILPAVRLFKQRSVPFSETYLCLILIFIMLLMDFGTVSYYVKSTYFYLMLFFVQVEINKRYLKEQQNGKI